MTGESTGAADPARPDTQVEGLLGLVTLSGLRRRYRERPQQEIDSVPPDPKLSPPSNQPWLRRSARHSVMVLFLVLGASTTLSLTFAASRLDDDGTLSAVDWFRLVVVGIIAAAFFLRVLATVVRLPPIRWITRILKRRSTVADTARVAEIPLVVLDPVEFVVADGFGQISPLERSRVRTQTFLDNLFWVGVNLALVILGGFVSYGLGYTSLRDIADRDADVWSYIRLAFFVVASIGLIRVFRTAVAQLRLRRQRRRQRALRRLLRYLLWWEDPPVMAGSFARAGHAGLLVGVLSPFLICCGAAVAAAAYSPWGEAPRPAATAESSDEPEIVDATEPQPEPAPRNSIPPDSSVPNGSEPPGTVPVSTPPGPVNNDPTAIATTSATGTTTPPNVTTAPPAATSTLVTTSPPPIPTTIAATATTTSTTTTSTSTTTSTTTTTTQPPAPPMVVNSLNVGFFCDGGTTRLPISWSVSGDPGGRVNVFRLRSNGSFVQIGSNVAFNSSVVDTIPANGDYQYWVIAANSDNVDTVRKNPGSGFSAFRIDCVD